MEQSHVRPLILGTAGHIDHGKTALVKALTGIDADRLPEEKARGMTIDLGFAFTQIGDCTISIVDVPGHEKFIRNMVAGATALDLVMLVVAADDAVMPQTREHLEIIDLLGVHGGLVALNKIDLVSAERLESARADVRAAVRATCLEGCPIVAVSAVTGEGLTELKEAIAACTRDMDWEPLPPLFRLPIDRRFIIQGHGTIVTGSLMSGNVETGDEVELMPHGRKLRVRRTQSHGSDRDNLNAGRRVAVNVAGVRTGQIKRGDELAEIGYLRPSKRLAVRIKCLRSAPMTIAPGEWLRLHIGTQNVDGRFTLIGAEELEPEESCFALLQTKEPICATHGQRFIIRSSAHSMTIGGGRTLCTDPPMVKLREGAPKWIEALDRGSERERILAVLDFEPALGGNLKGLYRETGVTPDRAQRLLQDLADAGEIRRSPGPKGSGFWTESYIEQCKQEILKRMKTLLERSHPRTNVDHGAMMRATSNLGPPEFVTWLLEQLVSEKKVTHREKRFGLAGYKVELKDSELENHRRLMEAYERTGFASPTFEEACAKAGLSKPKAEALYSRGVDSGDLIELGGKLTMHVKNHERLLDVLRASFANENGMTVSQIKDLIGVSRKYAIPICEHLDRKGYTRREGDVRYAGERLTARGD